MEYQYFLSAYEAWEAWGYALMSGQAYLTPVDWDRCRVVNAYVTPSGFLAERSLEINWSYEDIVSYAPEGWEQQ